MLKEDEAIVDGEQVMKYLPFAILYALSEGSAFEFLGCASEAEADNLLKRFEETGELENPRHFMREQPSVLYPATMAKVEFKGYRLKLHKSLVHNFE